MTAASRPLLIALSSGFNFARLFEREMSALLSNRPYELAPWLVNDERGVAAAYFEARNIGWVPYPVLKRSKLRREITNFSHVTVFWDGDDLTDYIYLARLLNVPVKVVPVELAKVRNKDRGEAFDVYIGRGTPWGNPFSVGAAGLGHTREEAIDLFRGHFERTFLQDKIGLRQLLSLRGLKLGCHCKPLACHGDVIASFLNSYEGDQALDAPGKSEDHSSIETDRQGKLLPSD